MLHVYIPFCSNSLVQIFNIYYSYGLLEQFPDKLQVFHSVNFQMIPPKVKCTHVNNQWSLATLSSHFKNCSVLRICYIPVYIQKCVSVLLDRFLKNESFTYLKELQRKKVKHRDIFYPLILFPRQSQWPGQAKPKPGAGAPCWSTSWVLGSRCLLLSRCIRRKLAWKWSSQDSNCWSCGIPALQMAA